MPLPRLGFIGIGLMGYPMSRRLCDAGFDVTVWNRSVERAAALQEFGATVAVSIAELMTRVDVVMLCLANTEVVDELVFGAGGVAENGSADQRLIDFSSSDPTATREFAALLTSANGMTWVDAPVSGGVVGAETGSLAIMCGGEPDDIAAIRPLLDPLAARVTHMGPVGSGQVTKICNQMVVGCQTAVLAEMVALAESSGVDACRLTEALTGGFADSKPFQILTPRMAASDYDSPPWHLRTLLKDLDMAVAQSQRYNSATPMSSLAAQLLRAHANRGHSEHDPATLVEAYRKDPTD